MVDAPITFTPTVGSRKRYLTSSSDAVIGPTNPTPVSQTVKLFEQPWGGMPVSDRNPPGTAASTAGRSLRSGELRSVDTGMARADRARFAARPSRYRASPRTAAPLPPASRCSSGCRGCYRHFARSVGSQRGRDAAGRTRRRGRIDIQGAEWRLVHMIQPQIVAEFVRNHIRRGDQAGQGLVPVAITAPLPPISPQP